MAWFHSREQAVWVSQTLTVLLISGFQEMIKLLFTAMGPWLRNSLERKGLTSSQDSQVILHHWGSPNRKPRQEPRGRHWCRNHEGNCLLACSSLLSYILQDHLPRGGPTHSGLGLSTSIINQENVPQSCPQAGLIEAIPHLKVLLLRGLEPESNWQKPNHRTVGLQYVRHKQRITLGVCAQNTLYSWMKISLFSPI